MPLEKARPFNMKDLTLDVRLETIIDGNTKDFTGRKFFSVDFFRESIGFGITDVDIEVNTSLQPIITITFKDLYGNTVFGKNKSSNPDLSADDGQPDFSALFNWPPPKFLFTFKGFLGKSATWMLNMKKSSVSYESSDSSYNIKCEFVPNQWGFLSDLPFLYLLAVKSLKKKSGMPDEGFKKAQTIFDLIKIGKQVEVKTKETTKEFDILLKQMTLLKSSRINDAININKIISYDETITGQVGNIQVPSFESITIKKPTGEGSSDIDTPEKLKSLSSNSQTINRINDFFLLTAQIGKLEPMKITWKEISGVGPSGDMNSVVPNFEQKKNERLNLISDNIQNIENAIKRKTFDSSKSQLKKITIGEIFKQLSSDAGYIMGRILEAGYQGYNNPNNYEKRKTDKQLIGKSFPLWINDKKEEKPATAKNTGGKDFGVELFEEKFVTDFIDSISEGIATELASDADASANSRDNLIKKRISNIEALKGNPYQPFYQSIAENILVRGGIVGYLTRSSDPNYPGDYDNFFGGDNASSAEDILPLADADLENITDAIIGALTDDDFKSLRRFCIFWDNLLTEDCNNLKKPDNTGKLVEGDSIDGYLSGPGISLPSTLMDYKVIIEKPANWKGGFEEEGVQFSTLKNVIKEIFRPTGAVSAQDSTNSNFISLDKFQGFKLVNNGLAYFKVPGAVGTVKNKNVFIMFDSPDSTKTQEIMSATSDAELKNDAEKQKEEKNEPLGYVNIQSSVNDKGEILPIIEGVNEDRIPQGLLLSYSRLLNPNSSFFKNPFSLVADDNINNYFIIPKDSKLGNPDNLGLNEIPAKNITISIAYQPTSENQLVFGPFVSGDNNTEKDSLVHRGYIKRMCSKLKEKLDVIEQKKNQVISDVLGKAGEQKDALYKQMHVLYQQWEVLIIRDSVSADSCSEDGGTVEYINEKVIVDEMSKRYSNHDNFSITKNVERDASDNTFFYAYPLNFIQGNKEINVKNSIISIEPLYKPNGNTTVLNIIQQVCTKNNFIFIPMPGGDGAFSINDVFSPHPVDTPKVKNFFYVQFAPTPESRSTLSNDNSTTLSASESLKDRMPDALEIKFGSPENQIIKNISVDTSEGKATAESIVNLQRLVDNENQNKTVTTDCSMLPVMEGRSYKASIDMLGNAQVFPMQFFFLDSIPLFNGLYQIMKVKHSIRPNDMTTTAEGIRMRVDFQTGEFGGIPPVTFETLADIPESIISADATALTQEDFDKAFRLKENDLSIDTRDMSGDVVGNGPGNVPIFNQGDSKWGTTKGKTWTIGQAGCCITSIAMISRYLTGLNVINPLQVFKWDNNDVVAMWAIIGKAINKYIDDNPGSASPNKKINPNFNPRQGPGTQSFLDKYLAKGYPVMIESKNHNKPQYSPNGIIKKNGAVIATGASQTPYVHGNQHWMVITNKNPDGTYNINDPNGGRIRYNQNIRDILTDVGRFVVCVYQNDTNI